MICPKCYTLAVKKQFHTFEYEYCTTCKEEVVVHQGPNLYDEMVGLLLGDDGRKYLYVSSYRDNLDGAHTHCLNNVDLFKTSTRIYFSTPVGVASLPSWFEGIWVDDGAIPEEDLANYLNSPNDGFIRVVDVNDGSIL